MSSRGGRTYEQMYYPLPGSMKSSIELGRFLIFSFNTLDIPMNVYAPLLSDYIRSCQKKKT